MYPCGHCRATAVGPDGRCAACGSFQQPVGMPPAYGYPGVPGGMPVGGVDLRRGVRIALTVLLSVTAAVLVLAIAGDGVYMNAIADSIDGDISDGLIDRLDNAEDFLAGVGVLQFFVLVATAVLWAVWFRRMRLNAEVFAPGTHRFGSGWAAGSWFTPVVNLWFPKQIANDIYRASAPAGPQGAPKGLLNAWWVLWIVSNVVGVIGSAMERTAERRMKSAIASGHYDLAKFHDDAHAFRGALAVSGFADLLLLAAAVFALLVVRQLSRMQEQRAAMGPPMMAAPGMPGMPGMPYGAPPAPNAYPQNPYGNGPVGY
ncbi:DUF4328 domain-containing protein [Streptomyces sp. NPDC049577]|uniref:DUF4328 domain-containing protein n=1 Tax=Streptomyces sp. NPDC049577 TaxID=3155153 RepID=UPI0034411F28